MLTVLGELADFERELIRTRTGEGRQRARARGQHMGRPSKLTQHQRTEAVRRRDKGEEALAEIGRTYNVSPQTIGRLEDVDGRAITARAERRAPQSNGTRL